MCVARLTRAGDQSPANSDRNALSQDLPNSYGNLSTQLRICRQNLLSHLDSAVGPRQKTATSRISVDRFRRICQQIRRFCRTKRGFCRLFCDSCRLFCDNCRVVPTAATPIDRRRALVHDRRVPLGGILLDRGSRPVGAITLPPRVTRS